MSPDWAKGVGFVKPNKPCRLVWPPYSLATTRVAPSAAAAQVAAAALARRREGMREGEEKGRQARVRGLAGRQKGSGVWSLLVGRHREGDV